MGNEMGTHEQSVGATDEWYTPKYVFDAMGCHFDMDVASPGKTITPWIPARHFIKHYSLEKQWHGFIWMNPPFGGRNGLVPWLEKFMAHNNGIALVPDRTSAPWWQSFVPMCDAVLFVSPRIKFIDRNGAEGKSPAQGTCLVAAGDDAVSALHRASGLGKVFEPA